MKIHQYRFSEQHENSWFYNGLIAETENYKLYADGEIELVSDIPESIDPKYPDNDSELYELFDKDLIRYNNWYEITDKEHNILIESPETYTEAIMYLMKLEREFNNE